MAFYYRFEDRSVSCGVDEFDNSLGFYTEVYLRKYEVIRKTAKGTWILLGYYLGKPPSNFSEISNDSRRFVLDSANKRFALPTIDCAKKSFIARKNRQIKIYSKRISGAKQAIDKVNSRVWED